MSEKLSTTATAERYEGYPAFEGMVAFRVQDATMPLFETDVSPECLWEAYLGKLPEARRQHYNCHACRRFIQKYGGLLRIENGHPFTILWAGEDVPSFFLPSVVAMQDLSLRARVTGVFLSPDRVWGTPEAGGWTHLAGPMFPSPFSERGKTAAQAMAEKTEDFKMLSRALADYSIDVARQAVRVLQADALSRGEKTLGVAQWFLTLHEKIEAVRGNRRENLIWQEVAVAPPGFAHIRSTMISTLLDDLLSGLSFDAISKRWSDKMHPLQYQRPTAAPAAGTVAQAEKLVEKLGLASALERRAARLEDVLAFEWRPPEPRVQRSGGVFGHLLNEQPKPGLNLPTTPITWEKFRRTILPGAQSIEIMVPSRGGFYGLVTAVHPDAAPLLQWDGLEGRPRNPVSWYFYHGGSNAVTWGLMPGWNPVSAVFLSPHNWQEPAKFTHQGAHAMFAIQNARAHLEIKVHDHGLVDLVDVMPRLVPKGQTADSAIVQAARVSYGEGTKHGERGPRLIRYLARTATRLRSRWWSSSSTTSCRSSSPASGSGTARPT
jgi:hypothetical protein